MLENGIDKSTLESDDVVFIARNLIGCRIQSDIEGEVCTGIITETEAYKAPEDKASHAYGNRRTQRTETMYGEAGTAYVYLCYGIHHLFNVVTGPPGTAHAVLIRSVQALSNIRPMLRRRKQDKLSPQLTAGPGNWTSAFGITTQFNGINLLAPGKPVRLLPALEPIPPASIRASKRIGIDYAGEWAHKPWRFFIEKSPWVSRSR